MSEIPQDVLDRIHAAVRKAAPARVWSQGVKLARDSAVVCESVDAGEVVLRVSTPGRPVAPTVVLYLEDCEWECDCPSSEDTCSHVAAAVIALGQATKDGQAMPSAAEQGGSVAYRLRRDTTGLALDRVILGPDGSEQAIATTLGALLSGHPDAPEGERAKRSAGASRHSTRSRVRPDQADLDIDRILGMSRALPPQRLGHVLTVLADRPGVTLDGKAIHISRDAILPRAVVEDHQGGARLVIDRDPEVTEVLAHGFVLCGDTIHPIGDSELSGSRLERLPHVRVFARGELAELQTRVVPDLLRRIDVEVRTRAIPEIAHDLRPRVDLRIDQHGQRLDVFATLVYGDPPNARIDGDRLVHLHGPVPVRNRPAEKHLLLELRDELHLLPGRPAVFEGNAAMEFLARVDAYRARKAGLAATPAPASVELLPHFAMDGDRMELYFELPPATTAATSTGDSGEARRIDVARVLEAWHSGFGILLTEQGERARLPAQWLERYGAIIADILAAKGERADTDELPRFALLDVARLCEELDQPRPPGLATLEPLFRDFASLPAPDLPGDLQATLRPYQRVGVGWLQFLGKAGLGAVLADDMGLGKTLQALCVFSGRVLVVCPTSVIHNWMDEIQRFRPGLGVTVYHGPRRTLDKTRRKEGTPERLVDQTRRKEGTPERLLVDDGDSVTLTTYAILRLDIDALAAQRWDVVVLDEAQAIKNPDSQVARAAYRLQAGFRVTMSGTPVENRLDELWSQFHFTNPGLLGGRGSFKERYADAIERGETGVAGRLRARIRPFLLRRLKREVAPELPPRSDAVLHCELDDSEKLVYEAIRATTVKEVTAQLAAGGSMLAAFEALLRLRQAACHPALLPGQSAENSSKVQALLDALELAAADDHKALVFSQWTSLLDLIEPHLLRAGIAWARLDGTTRNRGEVVASFQAEGGPPVMLISLKAGGFGLNLTAADHVFLCDPWWNPAAEDQAADRAHRIGQDRPVMVYRLVSKDTIEDRILALQARKRALADAALSEGDRAARLTRDDLLALLA